MQDRIYFETLRKAKEEYYKYYMAKDSGYLSIYISALSIHIDNIEKVIKHIAGCSKSNTQRFLAILPCVETLINSRVLLTNSEK